MPCFVQVNRSTPGRGQQRERRGPTNGLSHSRPLGAHCPQAWLWLMAMQCSFISLSTGSNVMFFPKWACEVIGPGMQHHHYTPAESWEEAGAPLTPLRILSQCSDCSLMTVLPLCPSTAYENSLPMSPVTAVAQHPSSAPAGKASSSCIMSSDQFCPLDNERVNEHMSLRTYKDGQK